MVQKKLESIGELTPESYQPEQLPVAELDLLAQRIQSTEDPYVKSQYRQKATIKLREQFDKNTELSITEKIRSFQESQESNYHRGLEFTLLGKEGNTLAVMTETGEVQEVVVTSENAKQLLGELKRKDEQLRGNSYDLRIELLVASQGGISTHEAFTYPIEIHDSNIFNVIKNPENWMPERQIMHEQVLAEEQLSATRLSLALDDEQPTIHALRGNTGAGKTSYLKTNPSYSQAFVATNSELTGTVNPDRFKTIIRNGLKREGQHTISHPQSHIESVHLNRSLAYRLYESNLSVVVDQRLEKPSDISMLIGFGKKYNKRIKIIDVDSPLEFSLSGVMNRKTDGNDPIPPFDVIANGYRDNRAHRNKVIEHALSSNLVESYTLISRKGDGEQVRVAQKQGEQLLIDDEHYNLFDRITKTELGDELNMLSQSVIDENTINLILQHVPDQFHRSSRQNLLRFQGLQVRDMVNQYAGVT